MTPGNERPDRAGAHRPRLIAGTVQVLMSEGLALPTGVAVAALLARVFGPEGYGVFALAVSLVAAAEWGLGALFSRATIALIGSSSDRQPVRAVLRWHLAGGVIVAAVLTLAAMPLAAVMDEPRVRWCLVLLAFEAPFVALATGCRGILTGRGWFGARAAAGAVRWIARLIGIGTCVGLGFPIEGAAVGSVIGALVSFIVARVLVGRAPGDNVPVAPAVFWHVAIPTFVLAMSLRLLDKLGLVALKVLGAPTADAGLYAAVQSLSIAPAQFAMAFSPLLLATMTRLVERGDTASARQQAFVATRVVWLSAPLLAIVAGSATEIVRIVYGDRFDPAAMLAAPLLVATFAIAYVSVASAALTAEGHAPAAARTVWPVLPLAIVGYIVFVPRYGAPGAAVTTSLTALVGAVLSAVVMRTALRIRLPVATCVRSLALSAAVYALADAWPAPDLLALVIKATVLAVGVAVASAVLGEWTRADLAWAHTVWRDRRGPTASRDGASRP